MQTKSVNEMKTTADFMNQVRIVFYALVTGPLIFFIIAYLERREEGNMATVELNEMVLLALIGLSVSAVSAGFFIYRKKMEEARMQRTLRGKLGVLFVAMLLRAAALEGASVFAVILFFLFGHAAFAGVYLALLIAMSMVTPTVYNISMDLRLPKDESELLKTGGAFPE